MVDGPQLCLPPGGDEAMQVMVVQLRLQLHALHSHHSGPVLSLTHAADKRIHQGLRPGIKHFQLVGS